MGRIAGDVFIGAFAIYLVSIGYVTYKGVLGAPEGSESDNSDDDGRSEGYETEAQHDHLPTETSPLLPNDAGERENRARSRKHALYITLLNLSSSS